MGHRVLVTGGTGSIGSAIVRRFRDRGDDVTFQYAHNDHRATALSERVGAKPVRVDFSRHFEPPNGAFDILVNNCGINVSDVNVHEVQDRDWDATLRVNLYAPFALIRAYLPDMLEKGWGRIINVGSIYSLRGVEGNLPYTVSKHALSGMTKTVAKEYGRHGITCNEICPGPVESDLMRRIAERSRAAGTTTADEYLSEVTSEIPSGRMAEPDEVAALADFMTSPEANYLNGASVTLDGGLIA